MLDFVGHSSFTRRKFLAGSIAAVAGFAAADALFVEPRHVLARRVEVRLKRLPEAFDGFRIAQLSDLHCGPYMRRTGVQRAVSLALSFRPDLLALTGDFVSHPFTEGNGPAGARQVEFCADVLAQIKDVPMIAILGNHDHWNDPVIVKDGLTDAGVTVLLNAAMPMERAGERLWIAGIDDAFVSKADMRAALRGVPATEATILLAHEPDIADHTVSFPVDLQLSGHSHGGQVRVPGIGALILPSMGRRYSMGLYRVGRLQVYTNAGLGVVNPPVRFLCPPEVTFMTLVKDRS